MDLAELKAQAEAARTVQLSAGGHTFSVRLPTAHESLLSARRVGLNGNADRAGLLLLQHDLLQQAITGWQGPRVGDVLPGHAEAASPLIWAPGVPALLLDAAPHWAETLADQFTAAIASRRAALEADAKN